MLDVKRVLKAAPTKMRSQEPLQQLWTPWGEQIASEWLSSNAAHKAFCPAKDGERKLENGRTPILNEHPRPTMVRSNHTMLNGFWDYAIVSIPESDNGSKWRKSATVLTRDEAVQVVKEAVRQIGDANRLILHFEAVDYVCACFINGQFAGLHVGGYLPFDVDVSAFVDPDDAFEIALCVYDPNDSGTQMRGKQKIEREGIWYTAQSGIWQSVWMEIVPEAYMQTLTLKGAEDGRLFIRTEIGGDKPNAKLHIVVTDPSDGTVVADERLAAGVRKVRTEIATRAEHLWSPEDPYLYDVTATLEFGAVKSQEKQEKQEKPQEKQDIVHSYCAFRTVEIKPDLKGVARFHLNGKPLFLKGVLDQGYWPDGLLTAPSDEALTHDITAMKESGFNMLRKHIKIESARWYYHCDRLGMLVWQDAVSGGGEYNAWTTNRKPTLMRTTWNKYRDDTAKHFAALGADDSTYRRDWSRTCDAMVHMLAGHPSIVAWVLFNEGWGQFDACDAAERIHALDPTRPIDATSGWYDQRCGDFHSVHNYFRPLEIYPDKGPLRGYVAEYEKRHKRRRRAAHYAVLPVAQHGVRAFIISEFGGLAQLVADHAAVSRAYGYGEYDSIEDWRAAVRSALASAESLESRGLAGYVYTQVSDVEEELNGLMTYDRRVNKFTQ